MATTVPTTTYADLGVTNRFTALMQAAIGNDSIYIAALDKINNIEINEVDDVGIDKFSKSEKAKLIAEMAAQIVPAITNQAMSVALQWAKEDRDGEYNYADIVAGIGVKDAQAADLATNAELKEEQAFKMHMDALEVQAQLKRDYGYTQPVTANTDSLTMANFGDEGTKYVQNTATKANEYVTLAKSYRDSGAYIAIVDNNNGGYSYTPQYTSSGQMWNPVTESWVTSGATPDAGLTAMQSRVQHRQYNGFDDNLLQHAVNSSAQYAGMILTETVENDGLLEANTKFKTALDDLIERYTATQP